MHASAPVTGPLGAGVGDRARDMSRPGCDARQIGKRLGGLVNSPADVRCRTRRQRGSGSLAAPRPLPHSEDSYCLALPCSALAVLCSALFQWLAIVPVTSPLAHTCNPLGVTPRQADQACVSASKLNLPPQIIQFKSLSCKPYLPRTIAYPLCLSHAHVRAALSTPSTPRVIDSLTARIAPELLAPPGGPETIVSRRLFGLQVQGLSVLWPRVPPRRPAYAYRE
jgi:hypothetical protein